ncbi:MAG: hypothetical protein IT352_05420 [Gemmatimonadales bacterium]|nr:hypothetical protein [Gemmatimonadales bacterium]
MTTPVKFFQTNEREPFRRIRVPPTHRFGSDDPEDDKPSLGVKIDGKGYDCGCRSIKDYDQKIGKKIGSDISDTLAKVIPFYTAFRGLQSGLSAFAKTIPLIGPKIAELVDDADPVKALLKFFGGKIDALLVESLFRNVPAWVSVLRNAPTAKDFEEQEVQGILVRSHQRYDGVPFSQWHRWYDWSFVVAPVGPSADLIGDGNRRRTEGGDSEQTRLNLDSRRYERHWMPPSANIDFSIQCEWDLGAIDLPVPPGPGQDDQSDHGAFFNPGRLQRDWGWPMAGQYFWAGGRSVYDCRGTTSDDKDRGLHLNQLRPLKAIATARFEGFLFDENRAPVQAIQFFFFASNAKPSGGDFMFKSLTEVDYEFVVQLPPGGFGVQSDDPRPIGSLPRFTLNTIDIGRRLLVHVTSEPFFAGVHNPLRSAAIKPVVTPVFTVPGRAPTHAHVLVPLSQLPRGQDNFGVVVTLGWHDPTGILAADVFEVVIDFTSIEVHDGKESGEAEWFVNFGANGRWFQRLFKFPSPSAGRPLAIPIRNASVTLFLARTDAVAVACHGMEEDGEGDEFNRPIDEQNLEEPPKDAPKSKWEEFLQASLKSRKLRLAKTIEVPTGVDKNGNLERERIEMPFVGDPVEWGRDVDQPNLPRTTADHAKASEVARALFLRTANYLFDANDPIGLIDQNVFDPRQPFGRQNDGVDTPNPHRIAEILTKIPIGGTLACQHTGYATTRLGRMGTLGLEEDPVEFNENDPRERHEAKIDYILRYSVTVRRPRPRGEPPPPPPPVPPVPPPPGPDPTIRPDSVFVRVIPGPSIAAPSVNVRVVPGPSIVPPSVTVRTVPGPSIEPPSVNVRTVPGPSIRPESVIVILRKS